MTPPRLANKLQQPYAMMTSRLHERYTVPVNARYIHAKVVYTVVSVESYFRRVATSSETTIIILATPRLISTHATIFRRLECGEWVSLLYIRISHASEFKLTI